MEGLVVLQDPTLINQALLIRWNIAVLCQKGLESPHRRFKATPYREFGTVGASNVNNDSFPTDA